MTKNTINELSKKTLGRYINRATDTAIQHADKAGLHRVMIGYVKSDRSRAFHADGDTNNYEKALKRKKGIAMATKKLVKEDPDATFGKNKPRLDGLPNNDWHGQGDVSYSNETSVVPGSEPPADLNGRYDAQPKGFEGEKMGRTRPKMDAIPDDGKWDPNYLESVTSAVLAGDHVALAEVFNSAIRAKIDAILFGEEDEGGGAEDEASEEGDDGVSIPNDTGVGPSDTESKSSIRKMRDAMKLKGRNLSPQEKMDVNFKAIPDSIMKNPSGLSG